MNTMLLDVGTWDLTLDASGNMALAQEPYALAQDAASACRAVLGEVYYDDTLGVDYFGKFFGQTPPPAIFQEQFVSQTLLVPDIVAATCVIESYSAANRETIGQIVFTDINHQTQTVSI
jgi:hypothetical protein